MPKTRSKQQLGVRGEDLACAELEQQGMQVLERNWRCRLGEIDIVAAEAGALGGHLGEQCLEHGEEITVQRDLVSRGRLNGAHH